MCPDAAGQSEGAPADGSRAGVGELERRRLGAMWEEDALVYSKREGGDLWRRLGGFSMLDDSLTQQREGSVLALDEVFTQPSLADEYRLSVAVVCHVQDEIPRLTLRWFSKAGCWVQCGTMAIGGVLQKAEQLTNNKMKTIAETVAAERRRREEVSRAEERGGEKQARRGKKRNEKLQRANELRASGDKRLKYNKDPFEVMSQTTATDFDRHDDFAHARTQQRVAAARLEEVEEAGDEEAFQRELADELNADIERATDFWYQSLGPLGFGQPPNHGFNEDYRIQVSIEGAYQQRAAALAAPGVPDGDADTIRYRARLEAEILRKKGATGP